MSRDTQTPILPPGQAEERPLFVIMVIMAFLASLTLIATLMGVRQSQSWQNDLKSSATVQIFSQDAEMASSDLTRAVQILSDTPGVKSAEQVSSSESRDLLRPWIGDLELPDDIALPGLIRLDIDPSNIDADNLETRLRTENLEAKFDDHGQWSRNLSGTWQRLRLALMGLLLLMLTSTIAISSFATGSVLRNRENIINVLGQVGASDKFISRLFVKRFLSLGLKAALTGVIGALLFSALFIFWQNLGTNEQGLKLALKFSDLFWLFALAILIGLMSALTAGQNTLRSIRKGR